MIEVLLTVVPSVCWLLLRCYRLLQTPAEKLIRRLHVDIPQPPAVCVDALGSSHVDLRWAAAAPDEAVFYALMVNGKDVASLARTLARLSGLLPDTVYSVQVLAVNVASSFVSQLPPVYVHTYSGPGRPALPPPAAGARRPHVPPLPPGPRVAPAEIAALDVAQVADEHTLMAYLATTQQEAARASGDHHAQTAAQACEEARLRSELAACRRQLGASTDGRAKKDLDLRDLERRKDLLTFARLKLAKLLRTLEASRGLSAGRLAELRGRVAKLREKHQQVRQAADAEHGRVAHAVAALQADIAAARRRTALADDALKLLAADKRVLGPVAAQLRALVHPASGGSGGGGAGVSLVVLLVLVLPPPADDDASTAPPADMFTRDGPLTRAGAQTMQKIFSLRSDWEPELAREIDILDGLDAQWKNAFRDAVATYVLLFNRVEAARAGRVPDYEPRRMSEHQASVQFAGFYGTPGPAAHEPTVLTPRSLNALMAALHQHAGSGPRARVALDHTGSIHEGNPLASPSLALCRSSPGPAPEQAYLNAPLQQAPPGVSNTLWNNSSQSSFVDSRIPFLDYSLQAQVNAEPLHPSVSQHSNLSADNGLLGGILLPSTSHYSTSNSIWLDRYVGANYGHNRTVSSGSHLWRNEGARREKSPATGFVSEFLPFSLNTLPSQNGSTEPHDQPDYDIRLM
ncbi:hypothetical protein METBIDRAFT_12440 [Metschnikowia bicuspidata var. bicuspidata NRRL YB-4993]|uniref:Fibronectin type-III domain-containing protein n=1 Tax=Metschnikowia bicuspidata var. bicuspidata NRRL YB-4993 TaxID=869754 RepID=A0A1A0H973_9ASCO|nr:hypothetical protein METBIDRAFT_12440 [Metschnikowia bicuspidata var. bicuspidata NRRL YB-4993]OBA20437.1 hypothetical protein METBIDRAFT_12440 [Metschnikowia bicuspidata var. bicuspidata NRRL YB-4993]